MGNILACGRPPATKGDGGGCTPSTRRVDSKRSAPPPFLPPSGAPEGFQNTHRAIRLLGRGAYADTWLFCDVAHQRLVAIKLFKRPIKAESVPAILREIGVQCELGPANIHLIEVYEALLTDTHLGLVMEYAAGGSLTSYVGEAWTKALPEGLVLREDLARYLFKQFVAAVSYCHVHAVAHRDLKLDNALLDGSAPPVLKICDFGFSTHLGPRLERAFSHLGTPEYMSPEILHNMAAGRDHPEAYDARSADVWAAGVFLCVTLLGAFPFDHSAEARLNLADAELDLWMQEVGRRWSESPFLTLNVGALPDDARDLLDRIFEVDPAKRVTVDGIAKHPWVAKPLKDPDLQAALEQQEAAQAAVDVHVRHRRIDQKKLAARMAELTALVEAASTVAEPSDGGSARSGTPHVRPLQQIDLGADCLRRVDLTEAGVLEDGFACDCTVACAGNTCRTGRVGASPPGPACGVPGGAGGDGAPADDEPAPVTTAGADGPGADEAAAADGPAPGAAAAADGPALGVTARSADSPFAAVAGRQFSERSSMGA